MQPLDLRRWPPSAPGLVVSRKGARLTTLPSVLTVLAMVPADIVGGRGTVENVTSANRRSGVELDEQAFRNGRFENPTVPWPVDLSGKSSVHWKSHA